MPEPVPPPTPPPTLPPDRCPRCGGGFHCGVAGTTPCACTRLQLSADLQAALSQRYSGCLCLPCLAALAAGAPLDATPAASGPR